MHDFLGEPAPLAQLGRALANLLVEGFERRIVLVERRHLFGGHDGGRQVALGGAVLEGRGALLTLEQELDATEAALNLANPGDDTHGVQNVGRGLVGVVALRDCEDEAVAFERSLDGPERSRPARRDGRSEARENDRPAEWQDRECLALRHDPYL